MIGTIIEKIKSFFQKYNADKKSTEINPNVEIDKKAFGNIEKALNTVKKFVSMPFRKVMGLVKKHKIATIIASITALVSYKTIVISRKVNKYDQNIEEYDRRQKMSMKYLEKYKEDIVKCERSLKSWRELAENANENLRKNKDIPKKDKEYEDLDHNCYVDALNFAKREYNSEKKYIEQSRDNLNKNIIEREKLLAKPTVKFYLEIGKIINIVTNLLQSALTKLRRPKSDK